MMKPDIYTKAMLTIIAIMLTLIACGEYLSPHAVAHAEGLVNGWQVSATPNGFITFSGQSGNIEQYELAPGPSGRVTEKLVFSKRFGIILADSQKTREQINLALKQELAGEAKKGSRK